jgi:transposase-like protein
MVLLEHDGNVKATAASFGVYPVLIYRWLKSFKMDLSDYRSACRSDGTVDVPD